MPQRSKLAVGSALLAVVALIVALSWQVGTGERAERTAAPEAPTADVGAREPAGTEEAEAPPPQAKPQVPPFDPETGLTGLVLDPEERTVAGATVQITYLRQRFAGGPPDVTTETDPDGRFQVGPLNGKLFIGAYKSGVGAGGVQRQPLPGGHVVIRLVPGARLQGRVYDEADKTPIPGVLVVGKMAGEGWSFERATTDEAGRFELRYLALDVLSLTFHPREHRQHTLKPRLKLGDNEPLEVALSKSPSVRGQVIDADTQEPVALESIKVRYWHNRPVRLLGEGRFELHATRGQTQFTVHANGYPKTRLYFKEGATDQTFTLSKGELVQVHVQDSSGQPLAGASVRVQKKWLQIHMQDIDAVPTDESGNADVRLPPKKYNFGGRAIRVTAELDSYYGPPVETEDFSRGAYSATVVLSPAALLEGRVVDASAQPLGGAHCVLKGPGDLAREHTTGLDGLFSLRNLPKGRLSFEITAPGLAIHRQDVEIIRAGTVVLPDIVLSAGTSITGTVVDSRGRRLTKYWIWAKDYGSARVASRGTVDAEGGFTLAGLTAGEIYNVSVGAPRGRLLETIPQVKAGTTLSITAEDYAEIRGRFVFDGAQAPAGVHARCQPVQGKGESPIPVPIVSTYPDGTFEVLGVKPARYRITVTGPRHVGEAVEVEVAAGEIGRVEVRLARGAFIEGTVDPLPARRLLAYAVKDGAPHDPKHNAAHAMTSAEGAFKLGPIRPGRYQVLLLLMTEQRSIPVLVDLGAGDTVRCKLLSVVPGAVHVRTGSAGKPIVLLDADGAGVPLVHPEENAQERRIIEILMERGENWRQVDRKKLVREALEKTDVDGEWRRLALLPGTYFVEFGGKRHEIEIKAGETVVLDLR